MILSLVILEFKEVKTMESMWDKIGNKCLELALGLLEEEQEPTKDTAETVRHLVETAVSIDSLNLRWEEKRRSGAVVFPDRHTSLRAAENSAGPIPDHSRGTD